MCLSQFYQFVRLFYKKIAIQPTYHTLTIDFNFMFRLYIAQISPFGSKN